MSMIDTNIGVQLTEFIELMQLNNITPEINTDDIVIVHPDVNRPAL